MIKIMTFPLDKAEEANEFMSKHTPIASEREGVSGGIKLTPNFIILLYEDGTFNYQSMIDKNRALIVGEIAKVETFKIEVLKHTQSLKQFTPKGYKKELKDTDLLELCKKEEGTDSSAHKRAKARVDSIMEIENKLLMAVKTIDNSLEEIKVYEQAIKSYGDQN